MSTPVENIAINISVTERPTTEDDVNELRTSTSTIIKQQEEEIDEIVTPSAARRENDEGLELLRQKLQSMSVEERDEFFRAVSTDTSVDPSVTQQASTTLSRLLASIPEEELIQKEYVFPAELNCNLTTLQVLSPRVPHWKKLEGMKLKDFVQTMHTLSFDDVLIVLFYHILKGNFIHAEVIMEHANRLAFNTKGQYIPYDKFLCECSKNVDSHRKSFLYCLYYYWFGVTSFPMRDVIVDSSQLHEDTISLIRGTVFNQPYAEMPPYLASNTSDLYITHNFIRTDAYGVNIHTDSDQKVLENADNFKMTGALVTKLSLGKVIAKMIDESAHHVDDSE